MGMYDLKSVAHELGLGIFEFVKQAKEVPYTIDGNKIYFKKDDLEEYKRKIGQSIDEKILEEEEEEEVKKKWLRKDHSTKRKIVFSQEKFRNYFDKCLEKGSTSRIPLTWYLSLGAGISFSRIEKYYFSKNKSSVIPEKLGKLIEKVQSENIKINPQDLRLKTNKTKLSVLEAAQYLLTTSSNIRYAIRQGSLKADKTKNSRNYDSYEILRTDLEWYKKKRRVRNKDKPSKKEKDGDLDKIIFTRILNNPTTPPDTIRQELGISVYIYKKLISKLLQNAYIKEYKFSTGKRGRNPILFQPLEAGAKHFGFTKTLSLHSAFEKLIARLCRDQGFDNVFIEQKIGDKIIEVLATANKVRIAYEIALEPSAKHAENLEKCIDIGINYVVSACRTNKILNYIKEQIRTLPPKYQRRIEFCYLYEFIKKQ